MCIRSAARIKGVEVNVLLHSPMGTPCTQRRRTSHRVGLEDGRGGDRAAVTRPCAQLPVVHVVSAGGGCDLYDEGRECGVEANSAMCIAAVGG